MTKPALADLEGIGCWIESQGTPLDADRWVAHLLGTYATLRAFPERCPVAPDDVVTKAKLRHLVVGQYRALFTVKGRVVFVLHVRHGQRPFATKEDLTPALEELDAPPE